MDDAKLVLLLFSLIVVMFGFIALPSLGKGLLYDIGLLILLLTAVFILAMNWVDAKLFSTITSIFGITFQPAKDYKINKQQNAVIKEVNGIFYTTGFITANLFSYTFKEEAAPEDDEDKMINAPETWERMVMNINFPFKFHVLASGLDVQNIRDELEGKRSYQEFQLSRAMQNNSSETAITDIRRKMSTIQAKIDRISAGEKPIATLMYIETTAIGVSEKASIDALEGQINQLRLSFSSLDVETTRVIGRELYSLFNFNFSIPTDFKQLANMFDQQS
ncbi:MAG: hypothetical protein M1544_03420 [Candidatus Marsarchaeota archaeon]|nr:hypothetical protein [Candidatus Marsarchaeota archaeon]MCL5102378.1 hypothetical protein [Candidatus Marsarchaeota archaeon]